MIGLQFIFRKSNQKHQSAFGTVFGHDIAFVKQHGVFNDRQSQPRSAGIARTAFATWAEST